MQLAPPGTPVTDPFLAAVRRRHRDVDLVLVPGPTPGRDDPRRADAADVVLSDEAVAGLRARLTRLARHWWPDDAAPVSHVRFGSDGDAVRVVARVAGRPGDGAALVHRLRSDLQGAAWLVRHHGGEVEGLAATDGEVSVRASHAVATGVVVLTLSSAELRVGRDRARALAGAGDR